MSGARTRPPKGGTPTTQGDRLPPHSMEAEQGVLGSILLKPECLELVQERLGGDGENVFYDLKHREVYLALQGLRREGIGIDTITLGERLRDHQKLAQVGGVSFISRLPDGVPSAANVGYYINVVWEKYLARCLIQQSVRTVQEIEEWQGAPEGLWGRIAREREEFEAKASRGTGQPRYLKRADGFFDECWARFFGLHHQAEPGWPLPIEFKFKVRPGETTLMTGDDGSGKSTVLSYFALHLAAQLQEGQKVIIASFEMPPAVSLWIMVSQLLGSKYLPDSSEGQRKLRQALGWLNKRVLFYDFLGIGDYRDVLDTFRYGAEREGVVIEILDSVMRIGIADDDYAQQGFAAAAFANHAKKCGTHMFYVIHENKADAKGKAKIRGSKLWSANADNVVRVERNVSKWDKMARAERKIANEKEQAKPDQEEIRKDEAEVAKLKREWDTHLVLQKQRYPGTRQNASRFIYFDEGCFQFRTEYSEHAVDWLQRWSQPRMDTNGHESPKQQEVTEGTEDGTDGADGTYEPDCPPERDDDYQGVD
jgi:energy-coupling factor transporter ATP-binding protein EcfA2